MTNDRTSVRTDEPDDRRQNEEQSTPENRPPRDRPGEPGYPSRAESRQGAMEANRKPLVASADTSGEGRPQNRPTPPQETGGRSDGRGEDRQDDTPQQAHKEADRTPTEGKPDASDAALRPGRDQKPTKDDPNLSLLERMPSAGDFANLAEEFDARAESRELAKQYNTVSDQSLKADSRRELAIPKLDDTSIRDRIVPVAADRDKAEEPKEPFQSNFGNENAEQPDDVESPEALASNEDLSEEKKSRFDQFRAKAYEKLDDIKDDAEKTAKAIDRIFGPHPAGHAVTETGHTPSVVDNQHSGIDPGSAASALLAVGIVSAELVRKVHEKVRGRDR